MEEKGVWSNLEKLAGMKRLRSRKSRTEEKRKKSENVMQSRIR